MTTAFSLANKPSRVVLWGAFAPLHDYLNLLREAEIEVTCLVDPLDQQTGGGVVPVRSIAGFVQDRDLYLGQPIVVLEDRTPEAAADPLWRVARQVAHELPLENPLLDPSFLAAHLPLSFPGRVFTTGFPGSGNGVMQAVVERLARDLPTRVGPREHLLSFLAGQRHQHLHHRLSAAFADLGRKAAVMSHHRQGKVNFMTIGDDDRRSVLYDLPDQAHLCSTIHKTHEIPTPEVVDLYARMGYRLLVSVRDPLDTLVSMAAKFCKPPTLTLGNVEWFRGMATALCDYYRAVLAADSLLIQVHYERLITEPLEAIAEIAVALEVECSPARAAQIWEEVGFRPLHFSPGHLWQPGFGKWRKYLDQRLHDVARQVGLLDVAERLGYHDSEHAAPASAIGVPQPTSAELELEALGDHTFARIYDREPTFRHPRVQLEEHPTGLGWMSNCPAATRQFHDLIGAPAMQRYLFSLPRAA